MYENPYQRYRQVQLETASPLELIIKLYEGALRFINLAKKGLADGDYQLVNNSLLRAQAIVNELNLSLNMDYEISHNLRELYLFINRSLIEANIAKDGSKLDEIMEMLMSLKDAWVQINEETKVKAVSGS